tara:strand:+ start:1232 stop:1702 length:471 start_codon:yes stop_codon:yes gene_type:complete
VEVGHLPLFVKGRRIKLLLLLLRLQNDKLKPPLPLDEELKQLPLDEELRQLDEELKKGDENRQLVVKEPSQLEEPVKLEQELHEHERYEEGLESVDLDVELKGCSESLDSVDLDVDLGVGLGEDSVDVDSVGLGVDLKERSESLVLDSGASLQTLP